VRELVIRQLKGRYRRSLLGPVWAILQPLTYLAVFSLLGRLLNISSDGIPYGLFVYSALVQWTFLSNAVTRCGPSVSSNAAIVKKIALPREVFPVTAVVVSLFDFFFASLVLAGLMLWYRVPVGWSLLWLPLLVLLAALLATGVGLGVAALGAYKTDTIYALPFLLQVWLLATPVLYPLASVPEHWQWLYRLNPMVGIVEGFRSALVKGLMPDPSALAWSVVGIGVVWAVTWPVFRSVSQYFADVL
jgi:lipopolysaccharide transport system permease protein